MLNLKNFTTYIQRDFSTSVHIYSFHLRLIMIIFQDLYQRIDQTRYTDCLQDCRFQYGFNSNYLRKVASYWRHEFNWDRQIKILNKYPHFKTNIEGELTYTPSLILFCFA